MDETRSFTFRIPVDLYEELVKRGKASKVVRLAIEGYLRENGENGGNGASDAGGVMASGGDGGEVRVERKRAVKRVGGKSRRVEPDNGRVVYRGHMTDLKMAVEEVAEERPKSRLEIIMEMARKRKEERGEDPDIDGEGD